MWNCRLYPHENVEDIHTFNTQANKKKKTITDYQAVSKTYYFWHQICTTICVKHYVKRIKPKVIMKKFFVAVALVMGLGTTVAFAETMNMGTEVVAMVNEYKPIEVKDLPQAVQDAIKKDYAEQTIKEAAVEETENGKTYQVVLTDKEGTETTVVFNEKGEVQK